MPGKKIRVCNSEDRPEASETFHCVESKFDYKEVRISAESWDTVLLEAWILQIILSEMLDVPTSVETANANLNLNFYNPENTFESGVSSEDSWKGIEMAHKNGDCFKASRDQNNYETCYHVVTEVWYIGSILEKMVSDDIIDPPVELGPMSQELWYIPKFTAKGDPSLTSYFGMQGEKNQRKLAETFLRPMTWKDYCSLISGNNCTTDDGVAKRSPQEAEYSKYFEKDLYTGHFTATDENDCENNKKCTGHIVDFPDGWESNIVPQTHYLNISLESSGNEKSNGYSTAHAGEIWKAANATRSNVVMLWWDMDPLYAEFLGTEAEFTKVVFPPATLECLNAKLATADRVSQNKTVRLGDPAGTCDAETVVLKKVIAKVMLDASTPTAMQSPAYEAVHLFKISKLELDQLMQNMKNSTAREAVCQWVVDNYESVKRFIPKTYPRIKEIDEGIPALYYVSFIFGSIAAILVLATGILTFLNRHKQSVKIAQVDFMLLILAGLLAMSIGSIIMLVTPTNSSCVATQWFINIGYTLELVPLIVKVTTVIKIVNAAEKLQRVHVRRESLFQAVLFIFALSVIFLILWSVIDPPTVEQFYITDINNSGETVVKVGHYCQSEYNIWKYMTSLWTIILLLCTSVLAVQMRYIRKDYNESLELAVMTYSHFIFVVLLVITKFPNESWNQMSVTFSQSILYSLDTIAVVFIYFVPKLMASDLPTNNNTTNATSGISSDNNEFSSGKCPLCGDKLKTVGEAQ
eukprot:CAMPEP_0194266490 /NCGR_PEP_ID=MMETSP0169-20130528/1370_1 /TAXON_ID=218684 /ORGANISM="Corethron pennatum, Strain L29A3" /LENGTH=749 /DNA_ID=CAMNT_0039007183 /DNA_START=258 /DNA_END=2507 /DNA_ORIENTATION=-